ncbi:MAG TPA: LysM domain-containing protein, partial [Vicinamibacterales bacterium]|nr:LysM domain-containing protein [Vicinamibacterales bacterium]
FTTLQEHVVVEGERLDLIAAKYLGDSEQFWRICDANGAVRPAELEVVGRRLRITLPEGLA